MNILWVCCVIVQRFRILTFTANSKREMQVQNFQTDWERANKSRPK